VTNTRTMDKEKTDFPCQPNSWQVRNTTNIQRSAILFG
jgi:hypothetical protein